jgi:hypothetical protein
MIYGYMDALYVPSYFCILSLFIATVMNVEVEVVSTISVRVSWENIDIPEIAGYTIYYKKRQSGEKSMTVFSSTNSVVIGGLVKNVEYEFEVVAIVEINGVVVLMGERSMPHLATLNEGK